MTSTEKINKNKWRVCRLCMSNTRLCYLFTTDRNLYSKLTACSLVQVEDEDSFPPFICEVCEAKLCSFYDFKKQCQETEIKLKEVLISGLYSKEKFSEKELDLLSNDGFLSEIEQSNVVENDEMNCSLNKNKIEKRKRKIKKINLKTKYKEKCNEKTAIIVKKMLNVNKVIPDNVPDASANKNSKLWHTPENISDNKSNTFKQFQCQLCGDVFKWKSVLNKHLITHSSDKARFGCSLCSKRFTRKDYLSTHMLIHAGIRPFVCEICARSFVKRQDLIRHKTIHSEERKFPCPECNKKFKTSANVHAHMRTHTGIVPYSCKHCSKGYKSRTGLFKHYNKNQCGASSDDVLVKCE